MRILILDDKQDMAESTALLLALHGHDARPARRKPAAARRKPDSTTTS